MTGNLSLALLIGVLYAVGTYLLLQRTLTRVVLGLGLLGHGANLLLLQAGGGGGLAAFVSAGSAATVGETADPLPQAMALTAIVITFGVTAFLLALAYRSWLLTRADEVQDDVEDRRVQVLGEQEEFRREAEREAERERAARDAGDDEGEDL